ncbi:hypothetical protein [Microbacterium sp.]|uniref:hypothetical protein n=1 Tax=Microbacterium sp. TaxID=51671 RepID=UPI0033425D2D
MTTTDEHPPAEPPGDDSPGGRLVRAVEEGDYELAAQIATRHVWPLFDKDYERLARAVGSLPDEVRERHPVLRLVHPATPAIARSTRAFDSALFQSVVEDGSLSPQIVQVMQMIAARISGDTASALVFAKRIETALRDQSPGLDGVEGPTWFMHHQIGSTLLTVGATTVALREFATARQIGEAIGSGDAVRSSVGRAALAHAFRGSLAEAERALAHPQMQTPLTPAYVTAGLSTERVAAALVALERLSPEAEALAGGLGDLDVVDVVWPFVMLVRARVELALQRPFEALEVVSLAAASHVVHPGSLAADAMVALAAEAHLLADDFAAARTVLEGVEKPGVLARIAAARLAVQESDLDAARTLIRSIASSPALGPGQRAELMVLDAWRETLELGRVGTDKASRLVAAAVSGGHRRVFASVPADIVDRLAARLPVDERPPFAAALEGVPRRASSARPVLTSGEQRALEALRNHDTVVQAAAAMHVSVNTLKTQLRSLYRKLEVSSRDEALGEASRLLL